MQPIPMCRFLGRGMCSTEFHCSLYSSMLTYVTVGLETWLVEVFLRLVQRWAEITQIIKPVSSMTTHKDLCDLSAGVIIENILSYFKKG